MSDELPKRIWATYLKVDIGHGAMREDFDWFTSKPGEACTEYIRVSEVVKRDARIAELEELLTAYESMESKVAGLENDLEKRGVRLCRRQK